MVTPAIGFGAALGTIAIITKHELVLAIIGGLFVLEAVGDCASCLLQADRQRVWLWRRCITISSSAVGRKHHCHSVLIISVVLALLGLATLKLEIDDLLPTYSGETAIFGLGRSGLAAVAALSPPAIAWSLGMMRKHRQSG